MSSLSLNVQQKFTNLRKKLDQLGYMQPLGIDSLPLVESLFKDFVWTTESFRKCKEELDKRIEVRDRVEEYIEPYKSDNARLLSDYNRLQKRMLELRVEHEDGVQDLQAQVRQLEQQKYDLALFNQQCLDKINKYEVEAKQMVQKIMQLQEKNFQAVVHTPEGKRKQIPFRRQRMDIDFFLPSDGAGENKNGYCCAVPKEGTSTETKPLDSSSSDQTELLDAITNKCKELTFQLKKTEEQLELSERKVSNHIGKLKLYEEEIARLTKELSGGRSLEAVSSDGQQRTRDRLVEQLNMQIDLLQQRNEELEKEIIRVNGINIKEGKMTEVRQESSPCQDGSVVETQNKKLKQRIEELLDRESSLLKELRSVHSKQGQKNLGSSDIEIENMHRQLKAMEKERNYWQNEADNRSFENPSLTSRDAKDIQELKEELINSRHEMANIASQNNELRKMLNMAERNISPPLSDQDRSRHLEADLKKCRAVRDSLQSTLDKFERQLLDIQGNIRVLTQERDMLSERYKECQKNLHELRATVMQSDKKKNDGGNQSSLTAQTLLRRLELERDDSLADLHRMTTERDSLRERLKTLTETALSEKARLSQKIEDIDTQKEKMCEERDEMIEKLSILRNKVGELEETNHQLIKRNDSLSGTLDSERSRLQNMAGDLHRLENDVKVKARNETQLADVLRDTETRMVTLQQHSDSQSMEIANLKNDCARLKDILNEVDREKDQMQSEVDAKSEQLRDIQSQLKLKEDALNEVRVNMSSLEQQLRRIQDVNGHRDKELRALVMHNEQLENDLRHEISKCDNLRAESNRLEEDLMTISRDQHKLEAELRESKRLGLEVSQQKDQLEQRVVHCQEMVADRERQNSDILEQFRHLSLEHDKMQLSLQRNEVVREEMATEVEAREKIVRHMREQLLNAETEVSGLQTAVRRLEDQVASLHQLLGNNKQEVEHHSLEKQEIIQELAAMRDLCARLEASKDGLQRQLSSRLLDLEQLRAENNDLVRANEHLREEVDSRQKSIQSLETVMSAGREKEFRNQMDSQQRIAELESQNEELGHLHGKVQKMQRDLGSFHARNNELEAECERLRRQLTSEKFKLELANQELLRRQKAQSQAPDRAFTGENEASERSEGRPNDADYYSSSSGVHTGRSLPTSSDTAHPPPAPLLSTERDLAPSPGGSDCDKSIF